MADNIEYPKNMQASSPEPAAQESVPQRKVIDEKNYQYSAPKQPAPAAVGRGGDPFFRRINATSEQLKELLDETATVQDWIQREDCNKVALTCLENEKLKDIYFEIKDGFGEYGPMLLMGFKTPSGVEIPRLKLLDKNGEVLQVLSGDSAIKELNARALAYTQTSNTYETIELTEDYDSQIITEEISEYKGNHLA